MFASTVCCDNVVVLVNNLARWLFARYVCMKEKSFASVGSRGKSTANMDLPSLTFT